MVRVGMRYPRITGSSFTFQLLLYRRCPMVAATGVVIAIGVMMVIKVYYTQHKGRGWKKRKTKARTELNMRAVRNEAHK